jgi:ketosteroid isomerase-like protein
MHRSAAKSHTTIAGLALLVTAAACGGPAGLSARDREAIRALDSAYVTAWLRDDTAAVLATLAPEAILMPAGVRPLVGDSAIRNFWWPTDGSRTRIVHYESTIDEIDGQEPVAYARGAGTLRFTYEKDTVRVEQSSRTMTLTILVRQDDGEWRIHRRMWGPLAP